jgi:serine/threonine protein kinase
MTGKTISHYKILEKLGEGDMGVVYLAEDTKLRRNVAIKFLPHHIAVNSDERKRFEIEAKAAASLNHSNIATIHAIEDVDGQLFLVMEYIKGRDLRDVVMETGPVAPSEAINMAIQIAEGLQAAHEKGIVHRDIKSSNIMITDKGKVKIMDFGLAKVGKGIQLTKDQSTLGTAPYMSPEQIRGETVDHRSDIWSFGVVLYEMLTGEQPFKGDYEQAVTYSIVNEEPLGISELTADIPIELERLIDKTLKKKSGRPLSKY